MPTARVAAIKIIIISSQRPWLDKSVAKGDLSRPSLAQNGPVAWRIRLGVFAFSAQPEIDLVSRL